MKRTEALSCTAEAIGCTAEAIGCTAQALNCTAERSLAGLCRVGDVPQSSHSMCTCFFHGPHQGLVRGGQEAELA